MSSGKGKSQKRRKTSNSKMYDVFVGSYVTVAVKDLLGLNSKESKFANLMIGGLMLDECETYIYLGSAQEVSTAIRKDQVIGIFVDTEGLVEESEEVPPGTIRQ